MEGEGRQAWVRRVVEWERGGMRAWLVVVGVGVAVKIFVRR